MHGACPAGDKKPSGCIPSIMVWQHWSASGWRKGSNLLPIIGWQASGSFGRSLGFLTQEAPKV